MNEFVNYLNQKFIESEIILIKYFIKKANMSNIFNQMNNDLIGAILGMLHPLNLMEIDYKTSMIDEKIRNYIKYMFDMEYNFVTCKTHLLAKPYFRTILIESMETNDYESHSKENCDRVLHHLESSKIDLQKFREIACCGIRSFGQLMN